MDINKDLEKNGIKNKKSILDRLSRRSTKVEPQPTSSHEEKNKSLINFNGEGSSRQHQPNPSNNNNYNNRISSQFTMCCSIDEKQMTPTPVQETKLNSTIDLNKIEFADKDDDEDISLIQNGSLPPPLESKSRPLEFCVNPTHDSKEDKKPVFVEYQPSIAMQSCRSRLRQKLLPPGVRNEILELNSHNFSSPNISEELNRQRENRSASYDTLVGTTATVHRPASTDSLARHALMAAQVLHLIPAEKVRERNYMSGKLAVTSLLGANELERVLPRKDITIFIGTWNMNGQSPPKQMNDFVLPHGISNVPDIIAIGTQESCSERFEWEVNLQESLGPTHILLHSATLGTLHLAIFIRRDLIWFCSEPEDDSLSVRPGTAFRTKGAVAISFCLFGTSMLFVTSHLTAHQQKVKERVSDIKRIINALDLPRNLLLKHKNKDVTQNFDSVYWSGDLNFRLSAPRDKLLKWIETTQFPLPAHLPHGYLHTDQLTTVLSDGAAFKGFKEANITFPPTYKVKIELKDN